MEKPSDNVGIPWLLGELNHLVDQRVITAQTATALQEYYQPRLTALPHPAEATKFVHSYIGPLLTAFAALFVGGGIILIFAHNWEEFSREMRAVIAILPAVFGLALACWTLAREESRAWREFTGIWLMISAYSCFGIIAQTYHLSGNFVAFMAAVVMMTLFVPLILRSFGAIIIQLIGFIAWGFVINDLWNASSHFVYPSLLGLGLLLGPLPYYLVTLAKKRRIERIFDSVAIVITSYFLVPILLAEFFESGTPVFFTLLLAAACTLLLIGRWCKRSDTKRTSFAWQIGGWLGIGITSMILSLGHLSRPNEGEIIPYGLLPILALTVYGIWRMIRLQWFEVLVSLLPTIIYIPLLLLVHFWPDEPYPAFPLWMTGTFVLFSILGAAYGFTKKDFGILNGSMAILLLAIIIRFFDGEYSALVRGIAFITSGVTILVVNLVATRLFRNRPQASNDTPIIQ